MYEYIYLLCVKSGMGPGQAGTCDLGMDLASAGLTAVPTLLPGLVFQARVRGSMLPITESTSWETWEPGSSCGKTETRGQEGKWQYYFITKLIFYCTLSGSFIKIWAR